MAEPERPYNWMRGLLDVITRGRASELARQKKEKSEGFDAMAEELHRRLAGKPTRQVESQTPAPGPPDSP
jgi:hypothetical protein